MNNEHAPCNLVLYRGPAKSKKNKYGKIVSMAREIAEEMSETDKTRLMKNPSAATLKDIMGI